jgi:hypothetical protein
MRNGLNRHASEENVPLEEMSYIFLGGTLIDMNGVLRFSEERNIPLSFYSEDQGDMRRHFVGRDYNRMDPEGGADFRIELLETMERPYEGEVLRSTRGGTTILNYCGDERSRVDTLPLFRLWEISLTPPAREGRVLDSSRDSALQELTIAYVINQGRDIPTPIRLELERHRELRHIG